MNTDNFQWTDLLVAEYSLSNMTLFEFKRSKTKSKKEYEILKCENDLFGVHEYVDERFSREHCLKPEKPCKIHSVKRLSDGEVFSIGDWVQQVEPITCSHTWQIKKFALKDTRCFTIGLNINCIKKVEDKKPILTTETIPIGDVPCLSVNDIKFWLEKYFNYPNGINPRQLIELVKQKLK